MTPRFGTAQQFAALRQFLIDSGYTEAAIRECMGIGRLSQALRMTAGAPPDDRLEALIQIFLLGETLPAAPFLPPDVVELLTALGLGEDGPGGFAASVELYPSHGLYIVSDRNRGKELPPGQDKVFSAITPNTEDFMGMLPETPCPAFLELCSGAGLAALAASARYAVQSFAYDISHRSTLFAEFNRRLNAIPNMTAAQGDLYQPAARRTFDRIAAHPPYVPSLRATELLRDGGEIGEDLTRRVIAGLPVHLHPGGRLYGLALIAETTEERVEQRIRRWLNYAGQDFDVVAVVRARYEPARVIMDNWPVRHAQPGDVERWQTIRKQARIEAFAYTSMIVQRRAEERPVVTISRDCGDVYPLEAVEALLRFAPLWDARPRAVAGIRMSALSRLEAGCWHDGGRRYATDAPFRFACDGPAWVAEFLAGCDGARTCRELQPVGTPGEEFARVVTGLAQGGVLRL
jgi:hypothetical protein